MQVYDAALLKHFGGVPFGATSEDVAKAFGTPDEIENLDSGDGTAAPVWHYWSKGFSLFFDSENGTRLCCVEADNSVILEMLGKKIFHLNENEVKELMHDSGYRELDEENHEWGEKRVTFDDANVDYYFEKGIMVSINFGVMF
ncbi:MAG TPA: hypothetical protein VL651_04175 [Bacteroidia bacterium]|jgi:hypothetical protein|nr:hypothetical protein [Bacteroidia bacterium]